MIVARFAVAVLCVAIPRITQLFLKSASFYPKHISMTQRFYLFSAFMCGLCCACASDAPPTPCAEDVCRDDDTLAACIGGAVYAQSCASQGKICRDGKCVGETPELAPECEQNACKDETTLIECNDGVATEILCNKNGSNGVCRDGKCVACERDVCRDGKTLIACENGERREKDCGSQVCDSDIAECVDPECSESECRSNDVLYQCNDGLYDITDCAENGEICNAGECAKPVKCEASGIAFCDGATLFKCSDALVMMPADCAGENKICDNIRKECVFECESNEPPRCADAYTREVCDGNRRAKTPCASGEICRDGACVADPCLSCAAGETCIVHECVAESLRAETDIGMPCRCDAADCNTLVSNRQVKKYLTALALLGGANFLSELKDWEYAVFPDYFSKSIVGCESLKEDAPEGMAVGCMRTASFSIAGSQADFLANTVPGLIGMLGKQSEFLTQKLPKIAQKLNDGIEFYAPNGYCFYGTTDVSMQLTNKAFKLFFIASAFDRQKGLFSDFIAGNREASAGAAAKAAAEGKSHCPEGSQYLSYEIKKDSPSIGKGSVAIDVCMKSCKTNADCRSGYECYAVPDGLPAAGLNTDKQPHVPICVDRRNIDAIKALRSELTGA